MKSCPLPAEIEGSSAVGRTVEVLIYLQSIGLFSE